MCQFAGKIRDVENASIWLACAIESEGSVQLSWGIRKNKSMQIVPRVNLVNKDDDYIEFAVQACKMIGLNGYVYKSKNGIKHMTWYGFKRVHSLLKSIYPYMVTARKTELLNKVLAFIDYRESFDKFHVPYSDVELDLFLAVRELNGKGRISKQEIKYRFKTSRKSSETIRQTPKGEDIVRSA